MSLPEITPVITDYLRRLRGILQALDTLRPELGLEEPSFEECLEQIDRQAATADERFTIALVGTFNSGKSTLINCLLQLDGEDRLSERDSPDTAKSVRLTARTSDHDADAVLHFRDGAREETTWSEARPFSSQVAMAASPALREKADRIVEIEYRLDHPLLATVDLLDLPGTGTRNWRTDTALTHQKLKEAELVFWVIGTCAPEPSGNDLRDLRILREVRANVVPLINVWSLEREGIRGMVSAEEMEAAIQARLSKFFAPEAPCLKLWAREIDVAQQQGEPLREEWGQDAFRDFLGIYLQDDVQRRREKIRRICGAVNAHLRRLDDFRMSEADRVEDLADALAEQSRELAEQEIERLEIGQELRGELRDLAADHARWVVNHLVGASRAFVDQELRLSNFRPLLDKLGGRDVDEKLKERFRIHYLHLDREPNWLTELVRSHLEDARILIEARWKRYLLDLQASKKKVQGGTPTVPDGFLTSTLSTILTAQLSKAVTWLLIGGLGVMLFIPGGILVEIVSLATVFVVHGFRDPLERRREAAKLQAQVAIDRNFFTVRNQLADLAMKLHNGLDEAFGEELVKRRAAGAGQEKSLHRMRSLHGELEAQITSFQGDMSAFETSDA